MPTPLHIRPAAYPIVIFKISYIVIRNGRDDPQKLFDSKQADKSTEIPGFGNDTAAFLAGRPNACEGFQFTFEAKTFFNLFFNIFFLAVNGCFDFDVK